MAENPGRSLRRKFALALIPVLLGLGAGEIVVRSLGSTDERGQYVFRNRVIRPFQIPIDAVAQQVTRLAATSGSVVIYDPDLGWTPRPGQVSANGLYRYNSQGIRSPIRRYDPSPPPGVLRIALFGNSYTHGDDVPFAASFGAQLEQMLTEAGIPAEVLNFGVGGYGIDQALLRYLKHGTGFGPHLVVLGFQAENLKRNLNLLRPLYNPRTTLPFAKPRFILADDRLQLINVPVLPLAEVVPILADFRDWELAPHEHFYDRRDYARPLWRRSKFLAVIVDLLRYEDDEWLLQRAIHRPDGPEEILGERIISRFQQEVHLRGAAFALVHLPQRLDLQVLVRTRRLPYQTFLETLDRRFEVVRTEQALLAAGRQADFANLYRGHFNPPGNRIVAEALRAYILPRVDQLRSGAAPAGSG